MVDSDVQCPVLGAEVQQFLHFLNYGYPCHRVYQHRPQLLWNVPADASVPRDKAAVFGDTIKSTLCNTRRMEDWKYGPKYS